MTKRARLLVLILSSYMALIGTAYYVVDGPYHQPVNYQLAWLVSILLMLVWVTSKPRSR